MSTVGSVVRIWLATAMSLVVPAAVPGQSLAYIGGLQYAAGDFIFTQSTWSAYLSNGLSWSAGRVRVTGSVPVVLQPAGWVQYSGTGMMVPTGGITRSDSAGSNRSGMGSGMHNGSMMPSSDMLF